jgi:cell division protein ZapB
MPSSKPRKNASRKDQKTEEVCDFAQLGLDFSAITTYSSVPRKETEIMNHELFETLETRVNDLLGKYSSLKDENARLTEENQRLQAERESLRSRVDSILGKLEGI